MRIEGLETHVILFQICPGYKTSQPWIAEKSSNKLQAFIVGICSWVYHHLNEMVTNAMNN